LSLAFGSVAFLCSAADETPASPPPASAGKSEDLSTQQRLKWNLDTLVGDYQRLGSHNPKWDASAKSALEAFARARTHAETNEKFSTAIADAAKTAVTNGCDDPMIKYLYTRYVVAKEKRSPLELAQIYASIAENLNHTERPPIRKFYVALRAAEGFDTGTKINWRVVHHWRDEAKRSLAATVNDKQTPGQEIVEAWAALLEAVVRNRHEKNDFYLSLEPEIFKNWPSESGIYLIKGRFYVQYAWEARGDGEVNTVTPEGWELFKKRLGVAEDALTKAWSLNPHDERIARGMMTVELGQGKGRARMEQWFERAMNLNPNDYEACGAKLYYLEPKWYGSVDAMLEFAHECLHSEKWGGRVPLIVVDAHDALANLLSPELRKEYWKQPEVWKDLHEAFEKFFRLNPNTTASRHNYALYAFYAEDWAELNRQLPLLGTVNYSYFGGKDRFDEIVHLAKEHAGKATP
jgi:hypothetical protein